MTKESNWLNKDSPLRDSLLAVSVEANAKGMAIVRTRERKRRYVVYGLALLPALAIAVYTLCVMFLDFGSDDLSIYDHSILRPPSSKLNGTIAAIFLAHDREDYFRESLSSFMKVRGVENVDIIVSMDFPETFEKLQTVVDEFSSFKTPIRVWKNVLPFGQYIHFIDDRITHHYKMVLERAFVFANYDYAIVLESDLTFSPDLIEFMLDSGSLLHPNNPNSKELFCISAWNDNGMYYFALDESRLFRTDFFNSLGFMIHKSMWTDQLRSAWPNSFSNTAQDIWLRSRAPTSHRDCLVPEVSRSHHIAKYGAHVSGESYTWYDAMRLATGNIRISNEEIELVGNITKYQQRVKNERLLLKSKLMDVNELPASPSNYTAFPKDTNMIVVVNDNPVTFIQEHITGNIPKNDVREINLLFSLFYYQFRSSHKGMMTVSLNPHWYGGSNLTLVSEKMRDYWLKDLTIIK